jgi:hypothetical protein
MKLLLHDFHKDKMLIWVNPQCYQSYLVSIYPGPIGKHTLSTYIVYTMDNEHFKFGEEDHYLASFEKLDKMILVGIAPADLRTLDVRNIIEQRHEYWSRPPANIRYWNSSFSDRRYVPESYESGVYVEKGVRRRFVDQISHNGENFIFEGI